MEFGEKKEIYAIGELLNVPKLFTGSMNAPHSNVYMYDLFKKRLHNTKTAFWEYTTVTGQTKPNRFRT